MGVHYIAFSYLDESPGNKYMYCESLPSTAVMEARLFVCIFECVRLYLIEQQLCDCKAQSVPPS